MRESPATPDGRLPEGVPLGDLAQEPQASPHYLDFALRLEPRLQASTIRSSSGGKVMLDLVFTLIP